MSQSEDVKTLFRRFGGSASSYQEVVSKDQVAQAEEKWPMLGLISPSQSQEAPSVKRAVPSASVRMSPASEPVAAPAPSRAALVVPAEPVSTSATMFSGLVAPAPTEAARPGKVLAAPEGDLRSMFGKMSQAASVAGSPTVAKKGMFGFLEPTPEAPAESGVSSVFGRLVAEAAPAKAKTAGGRAKSGSKKDAGLKAVFDRMVEPPAPVVPAAKKAAKPKKAVKW